MDEQGLPPGLERWLPREGISGLLVRCRGSRVKPTWHGTTGLYGFVGLPPGPCLITIEDPQNRFLPARLALNVPDSKSTADALRDLQRPAGSTTWMPPIARVLLRTAGSAPRRAGATGVWGDVRDQGDRPVPHALVQLETRFRGQLATATTWSDDSGGYVLDLDGERPDPMASPADVVEREGRLCLPIPAQALDSQPWLERLPELNASMVQAIKSGSAPAGYSPPRLSTAAGGLTTPAFRFRFRDGPGGALQQSQRVRLKIGYQTRCDLVLL